MTFPLLALQAFGALIDHSLREDALESQQQRELALRQLQAAIDRERLAAQVHIADAMISAARHVFDRKADLMQTSFNAVLGMIDKSIQELHETEKAALRAMPSTKEARLSTNRIVSDARQERLDLVRERQKLTADMFTLIGNLELNFPVSLKALPPS